MPLSKSKGTFGPVTPRALMLKARPYPKIMTHLGKPWNPSMIDARPGGGSTAGPHMRMAFDACRKNGALRYFLGRRMSVDKRHRILGSLAHLSLAYHYATMLPERPGWLDTAERVYADDILHGVETASRLEYTEQIRRCIKAYVRRFKGEPMFPVAAELEIIATLGEVDPGGPWPELDSQIVTARIDLAGVINGMVDFIDFKCEAGNTTRGVLSVFHEDDWAASRQFREILTIARARYTNPIRGVVIRRLMREPPFDFDTQPVLIPTSFYEMTGRQMRESMKRVVEAKKSMARGNVVPSDGAKTDLCNRGPWGPCDYLPVCKLATVAKQVDALKAHYSTREELYERSPGQ